MKLRVACAIDAYRAGDLFRDRDATYRILAVERSVFQSYSTLTLGPQ